MLQVWASRPCVMKEGLNMAKKFSLVAYLAGSQVANTFHCGNRLRQCVSIA